MKQENAPQKVAHGSAQTDLICPISRAGTARQLPNRLLAHSTKSMAIAIYLFRVLSFDFVFYTLSKQNRIGNVNLTMVLYGFAALVPAIKTEQFYEATRAGGSKTIALKCRDDTVQPIPMVKI